MSSEVPRVKCMVVDGTERGEGRERSGWTIRCSQVLPGFASAPIHIAHTDY